jgi:hypothetical protein
MDVPRAEVVELLGLPADVSDEDLGRALTQALERQGTANLVSAAEAQARAQDRSIVTAAVNDGRLHPTRIAFWLDALQRDRAGCRQVLASLAAGLKPAVPIADPDVEVGRQGVMASLKRAGIVEPPRPIAAAAAPLPPPGSALPQLSYDSLGMPIAPIPGRIQISPGKPADQWTQQEMNNAVVARMAPQFRGHFPTPKLPGFYQPTGSEHSLPEMQADGSVEWHPNPHYRSGD